jgi:hypothetical protein
MSASCRLAKSASRLGWRRHSILDLGVARVLEFNRISADQFDFQTLVSPRGKGWTSMPVRWGNPQRFRARVLLEEEELWITVPLEFATKLESGELKLTYKRNREGEVKIYRIGRQ